MTKRSALSTYRNLKNVDLTNAVVFPFTLGQDKKRQTKDEKNVNVRKVARTSSQKMKKSNRYISLTKEKKKVAIKFHKVYSFHLEATISVLSALIQVTQSPPNLTNSPAA